jgi:hypothetical protein
MNEILYTKKDWDDIMIPIISKNKTRISYSAMESSFPNEFSPNILAFGYLEQIITKSIMDWGIKIQSVLKGQNLELLKLQLDFITTNSFLFSNYVQKQERICKDLPKDMLCKFGWVGLATVELPYEHTNYGIWLIKKMKA